MQWLIEMTGWFGAWTWLIFGACLMAFELLAPGFVFIWFGLAGVATGLITFALGLSLQSQLLVFAFCSIASLVAWWKLQRSLTPHSADPTLNERANRHIGREFILGEPIISGHGRVKIDDSFWRISGEDCAAGTKVIVFATDGATLSVRLVGTS